MPETVAVTGASGFVGAHVTKALLAAGHRVRGTVRDATDAGKTSHLRALPNSGGLDLATADLRDEHSFDEAFSGCEWICHVASPVSFKPKDPVADIIEPAVVGTLNVLKAAARSGSVRRVVLTSSTAAVHGFEAPSGTHLTERDWNETSSARRSAYLRSKVLAERAAWHFVESTDLELVTILPPYAFGPVLCRDHARTSVAWIDRIVRSKIPMIPNINLALVDVEDVAVAHVRALERPEARGRYMLVRDTHWFAEIVEVIRRRFPDLKVPRRRSPIVLTYLSSLFDDMLTPYFWRQCLGKTYTFDSSRAQRELGIEFKPFEQSVVETVESILALDRS
jgi:dihydroflavonol-4-reductase